MHPPLERVTGTLEEASVLLLGRVMSGAGGERIFSMAQKVLAEEYPELSSDLLPPDDTFRRVGQSMAAATLPSVKG